MDWKPGIWTRLPRGLGRTAAECLSIPDCPKSQKIVTAEKSDLPITGYSSLELKFPESDHVLLVNNVALVPDAGCNLISSRKLDKLGNELMVGGGRIAMLVGADLDFKLTGTRYSQMLKVLRMKLRQRPV